MSDSTYWDSFEAGEDLAQVEGVNELEAIVKAILEGKLKSSSMEGFVHGLLCELGQWAGAYSEEQAEECKRVLELIKVLEAFV